ncbi:MAG: PadR family transcriptional regulator [Gemmatimonadetes bacterium]|nr:PadR family transcriptional regulator [Gemmatimonadota bacterium]
MTDPRPLSDHLPLHPFEFRILMALLDGPSYGTRIVEQIEARVGRREKIYPANLYRRIRDLLRDGLVEETAAPEGVDPRRTYVRLTPEGRHVVRAEAQRLKELLEDAAGHQLLPEA